MKTKGKVSKNDNPEKEVRPSNIVQESPKKGSESGVSVPHFEAKPDISDGFTRRVIAFFTNEKGEIAWDRMREATKDDLREFIKRPDVRKNLGLDAETDAAGNKPGEPEFGQDEADAFFDLLQSIERIAGSRFYKVPAEIANQAFTFTPDHRKKLSPVYIRLMNKWGPLALKKWKDEVGAAILTLAIVNSQIQTMHMLEEKRKRLAAPPRPVTPISETEKKEVDLAPSAADTLSVS